MRGGRSAIGVIVSFCPMRARTAECIAVNGDEYLSARSGGSNIDACLKFRICRCIWPADIDIRIARHNDICAARFQEIFYFLRNGERHTCLGHARWSNSTAVTAAVSGIEDDGVSFGSLCLRCPHDRLEDVDDKSVRLVRSALRLLFMNGVTAGYRLR